MTLRPGIISEEGQRLSEQLVPRVLPAGWRELPGMAGGFINHQRHLAALFSVEREADGKRWIHVSVSHRDRVPTWDELRGAKDWLLGKDRWAISIFPVEAEYVNHHPYVLHLWHCLDGAVVPDMRKGGTI
jgi:hypothetical protein